MVAGSLAGAAQCLFATPNELIKIKQQGQPGRQATTIGLFTKYASRGTLFQGWWGEPIHQHAAMSHLLSRASEQAGHDNGATDRGRLNDIHSEQVMAPARSPRLQIWPTPLRGLAGCLRCVKSLPSSANDTSTTVRSAIGLTAARTLP